MKKPRHVLSIFLGSILILQAQTFTAQAQTAASVDEMKREANDLAVSIVVSGLSCTCARFAEDIRNVVNDLKPNGIRVLPMLGVGGLQNLNDVLFLRGADMAVVDQDNMALLKKRDPKLYANIERRVQYITKLYTAEFHVLAVNDIKSYADLEGKKVNFNLKDSQTEVTADRVFEMLNISVEKSYYDNDEAIQRLQKGEISAMIVLTGGPQAALAKLTSENGVHFLPLDKNSLPGRDTAEVFTQYYTTNLTHKLYPNLIPEGAAVPTIANHALLVTYAWPEKSEKYRRMARFVNDFFGKIDQFNDGSRHPKWAEFNLRTEIPGWTRFKPAEDWIEAHSAVSTSATAPALVHAPGSAAAPTSVKAPSMEAEFEKALMTYQSANGNKPMSAEEKEFIINKLKLMLDKQTK
jgi:uncharacterized protein